MQILLATDTADLTNVTHLTIAQGAEYKHVTYQAMLMWLRNNNVPVDRIGARVLIRKADLERYNPVR